MYTFQGFLPVLALLVAAEAKSLDSAHCGNAALWCQSVQMATQCNVLKYCQKLWESDKSQRDFQVDFKELPQVTKALDNVQPVKVSLYFESLCPGCRQFFMSQMYPTFQKLQSSGILEVELVPYGNAQERSYGSQWIFYCQHGQGECVGNVIETCGISIAKGDASKFMPFIFCLETYGPTMANINYCASMGRLSASAVSSCASSSQGNQLQHQMALKTQALNPPHQYVPWITVNGYHSDQIQNEIQSNMLGYVCSAYRGVKPAACN